MGWEKAWTDIEFHVTSNTSNPNYSSILGAAQELATKYTEYIDNRMDKEKFWMTKDFVNDSNITIGTLEPNYYYPLNKSRAASELNNTLKKFYIDE